MTETDSSNHQTQGPPRTDVQSTPPYASPGHDFTLQAIMELQKSNGQLTEAVNSLKTSIDKQDSKLDKLEIKMSGVTHKIYAATIVLAICLVVGGFLVNKLWDLTVPQLTQESSTEKTAQNK